MLITTTLALLAPLLLLCRFYCALASLLQTVTYPWPPALIAMALVPLLYSGGLVLCLRLIFDSKAWAETIVPTIKTAWER